MSKQLLAFAAALSLLAGCDGGGTQPDPRLAPGTFAATLSGTVQAQRWTGKAGAMRTGYEVALSMSRNGLVRGDGLADTAVVFYFSDFVGLAAGTYAVGEWPERTRVVAQLVLTDDRGIPITSQLQRSLANAGTITVTRITRTEVVGEYSVNLALPNEPQPTVHAEGAFRATCEPAGCTFPP